MNIAFTTIICILQKSLTYRLNGLLNDKNVYSIVFTFVMIHILDHSFYGVL